MPRGGVIEFGARRIALLPEPGDENLLQTDPLSLGHDLRPLPKVVQHIGDRLHFRDGMVELIHRRPGWVRVGVDESWQHCLARKIGQLRLLTRERSHGGVRADSHDPAVGYGNCLSNRKLLINGHDLAVKENRVRRCRRASDASPNNSREMHAMLATRASAITNGVEIGWFSPTVDSLSASVSWQRPVMDCIVTHAAKPQSETSGGQGPHHLRNDGIQVALFPAFDADAPRRWEE